MQTVDFLISARWVIPIEPAGVALEAHSVAVHQGRIVAIAPTAEALGRFAPGQHIERPSHVLLPGFVNAHTHAGMTLLRGAAEAATLDRWLSEEVRPLEQRWMDPEYVRDGTALAIADMLTSGTTCFADMHLFAEISAQTAAEAGMRAAIGVPVLDAPTIWADSAGECLEKGLKLHDEYRDDPLVTAVLAPHAPEALSDETLMRVRRAADELEMPMTMHVNETAEQACADVPADPARRTIARLERLGMLSPLLVAVHAVHVDAADLERLARGGVHVVHCPQSNLKLGNGVCPVPQLRAQGINVALGTDGAASNNDLDMLDELRTAALLARGLFPQATVSAHEWLEVATLNGARALGLSESIGSIAPGKWADLCCIDLDRPQTQPVYDPAVQIVYSASRDQVSDVWVAGRALVTDGTPTRIDLTGLMERARRWGARIAGRGTSGSA